MKEDKGAFLKGFEKIKDILFVRAGQEILITKPEDEPEEAEDEEGEDNTPSK